MKTTAKNLIQTADPRVKRNHYANSANKHIKCYLKLQTLFYPKSNITKIYLKDVFKVEIIFNG